MLLPLAQMGSLSALGRQRKAVEALVETGFFQASQAHLLLALAEVAARPFSLATMTRLSVAQEALGEVEMARPLERQIPTLSPSAFREPMAQQTLGAGLEAMRQNTRPLQVDQEGLALFC